MIKKDLLKRKAAVAALDYIKTERVIGLGSGSTVNHFIDLLQSFKSTVDGVVAASSQTEARLESIGINVLSLNDTGTLPIYIDGADEIDDSLNLVKGGGAALTREKIIASASQQFICIADYHKKVSILGKAFPLPIEVIPMARSFVARELVKLGGRPVYRERCLTDNGNNILDVYGLALLSPAEWEVKLNGIAGVVAHGLFVSRRADTVLLASEKNIITLN